MTPDRPPRSPRIKDVANRAGVSTGTVSNVLNQPERVRDETAARVRRAIAELGFVRDANASSLASGRSHSVGLVVIQLANSLFVDAAQGAQAAAREAGFNLLIADSDDDYAFQSANVDAFNEARAAGLLLAPMQDSSEQVRRFIRRGRPVVLVNYDPGDASSCCVIVDNEQAGYLAARHLAERGCAKIAFLYVDDSMQPVVLRRKGVRRAMAELAGRVVYEEIAAPSLAQAEGAAAARAICGRGPTTRPDGLIAVTDTLAVGVINELISRGVCVPGDIAVMGCDDNRLAPDCPITVSSVRMRGHEMGAAAMRLLIDEVKPTSGKHVHQRVVLEPVVVARMSTAPDS
ncbi:MAG: LacI family transcriptional regulator [Bifidobacteriaceae bacterium]|jgi:LacI family transcriptional regulator|nr:LacI family transcriptional regulator [Bifidobacteriaceae bacterium]